MKIHAIGGMPRSGSTLLCNILNQNPKFFASSTSVIPGILGSSIHVWSSSVEVQSDLNRDKEKTEEKIRRSSRSFIQSWYEDIDKEVVFDKSRGWNINSLSFFNMFPDSKLLVLVRDLRSIAASCEKQHRKNPLFDPAATPAEKTLFGRNSNLLSDQGVIGSALMGVEDLLRRNDDRIIFIQYESLVNEPENIMKQVYERLGEKYYEHDFNNVPSTATDPDGFYLWKFPHNNASGKVVPQETNSYQKFLSKDIVEGIMQRGQFYNKSFGYF